MDDEKFKLMVVWRGEECARFEGNLGFPTEDQAHFVDFLRRALEFKGKIIWPENPKKLRNREGRLYRLAKKNAYRLRKFRGVLDQSRYLIYDPIINEVAHGGNYELTLEEAENFLKSYIEGNRPRCLNCEKAPRLWVL